MTDDDGRWEPVGFDADGGLRIHMSDAGVPTWCAEGTQTAAEAIERTRWRANRLRCIVEYADRWLAAMEARRG